MSVVKEWIRRLRAVGSVGAALVVLAVIAAPAQALEFGIKPGSYEFAVSKRGVIPAEPESEAGAHPDLTVGFELNETKNAFGLTVPFDMLREVQADMPPGFIGDPRAVGYCTDAVILAQGARSDLCPSNSQVGEAVVALVFAASEEEEGFGVQYATSPLYNVRPRPGAVAELGFITAGSYLIHLVVEPRTDGDYGLRTLIENTPSPLPLMGGTVTIWGDPAEHTESAAGCAAEPTQEEMEENVACRREAFLSNPTWCSGAEQPVSLKVASWEHPSVLVGENTKLPAVTGCEELSFGEPEATAPGREEPSLGFKPSPEGGAAPPATAPAGFEADLTLPFDDKVADRAEPTMREAKVALPKGVTTSPSAASGLGACSEAEIGLEGTEHPLPSPIHFSNQPAACPPASKIGNVEVATPLLDHALQGSVYLARQRENPFGSLLAIYMVLEDPQTGLIIKVPARVEIGADGQLTTVFSNLPQLPYTNLKMKFFGGPRAALAMPPACGTYTTESILTPWSGTAPVKSSSSFTVSSGPNGPCPSGKFAPKLEAGTVNPAAGDYSPFRLRLSREDGSQLLSSIDTQLPPGLIAKLAGVPYCPDAVLAAIPTTEGSGAGELASPSCPPSSYVGRVTVGAGPGPDPFYVQTGRAYLAGPYKGAPLSLAVVVPALAGPFDLGNVVVRVALHLDPESTQVTAVSDKLPTILDGFPLDLRDVRVNLDREGFTLNPTSCEAMAIDGTVGAAEGASASLTVPFQASGCAALGFKPRLALKLKGGTRRGKFPRLRAILRTGSGEADIRRVRVSLPHSEFLETSHIRNVCTRVQFNADACPKGSIYGHARAFTPLLEKPLEGPVYLRSSNRRLPDLVADLRGQVHVVLDGAIGSVRKGISTTFATVPDTPVSKFVLTIRGGRKQGLLINSRDLCSRRGRATVRMVAQNGRVHSSRPALKTACGGKKTRRRKRHRR